MTTIDIPYMLLDNNNNTEKYYHWQHLKTGVCEGDIGKSAENKLYYEFPAINNNKDIDKHRKLPLRLNINRLIFCTNPSKKDPKNKIIIPKSLSKYSNEWVLRIIYECSGLIRGNTLVWYLSFARHKETIERCMKKYLWNDLSIEEQEHFQDTYVHYLTILWTILMYEDTFFTFGINQSIKKALLREIQGIPLDVTYVLGHIAKTGMERMDFGDARLEIVSHMNSFIEQTWSKDQTMWDKEHDGIPSETVEQIHFELLLFVLRNDKQRLHGEEEIDWFPYIAWCKVDAKDLPDELSDTMKNDLYHNYDVYDFDVDNSIEVYEMQHIKKRGKKSKSGINPRIVLQEA